MQSKTTLIALLGVTMFAAQAQAAGFGNAAPIVDSLTLSPSPTPANASATINCAAHDTDGTVTLMKVTVSGGTLPGGTASEYVTIAPGPAVNGAITWTTPPAGSYSVTCGVKDSGGTFGGALTAFKTVTVEVTAPVGSPPAIASLDATETEVFPGSIVHLIAVATDADSDPLTYAWSATGGAVSGSGPDADWTAPTDPGTYTLQVTVTDTAGQSASASILLQVVWAKAGPAMGADAPGAEGEFYPDRVAVDAAGNVYVTEPRMRFVVGFTPLGRWLRTVPVDGRPAGLAVDREGNLLVGDLDGGRILVIDRFGFDAGVVGAGVLQAPVDLALDAIGRIYVADGSARAVKVFGPTGDLVLSLAVPGFASGVALGESGDIYVSDGDHGTVHTFSPAGEPLATLAGFGADPGQLVRTGGVAIGPGAHLYVVDAFQAQLSVYSGATFVTGVGTVGAEPGGLLLPVDVATDPWQRLVVTNVDHGRLEVYELPGSLAPACANDSDCDGMTDAWEVASGFDPESSYDAYLDVDNDGLVDLLEEVHGTDPRAADTDDDGAQDLSEILAGLDPLDPRDHGLWADAGADAETDPTRMVLDGTGSKNDGAVPAAYEWTQTGGPGVVLKDSNSVRPWFVARQAGTYTFELRVGDGTTWSPPDAVAVIVRDVRPVADSGPDLGVALGDKATLDGRFSGDANGQSLTYEWQQVDGLPVLLDDPIAARPSFVPPATGVYAFELVVSDGASSEPDRVYVVANHRNDHVPVADAKAMLLGRTGDLAVVNASTSADSDLDPLTYAWRQLGGPEVVLTGADTALISFLPPVPGLYELELVVSDGEHASVPKRVTVAVHDSEPPHADAGLDRRALVLDEVTLPCPAPEVTCVYTQTEGVPVTLNARSFMALEAGTVSFELQVYDDGGPGERDTVTIVVDDPDHNFVPEAAAYLRRESVRVGQPVMVHGLGSADPDSESLDRLMFTWTQVRGPGVILRDSGQRIAVFVPNVPGLYGFELRVDDGMDRSPPALVEVEVPMERVGK